MEHYFYDPWFKNVDLDPLAQSFVFYANNAKFDDKIELSRQELDRLLKDKVFKNGFVLSVFTNSLIIDDYKRMKDLNKKVVELINKEITKG
jgi:hypothetical protein